MTKRTTHVVAHFSAPFTLSGFAERQPAGAYALDRQEELVAEVAGPPVYQRVAMFMYLPTIAEGRWILQTVPVEPADIETAILHEVEQQLPDFDQLTGME